MSAVSKTRSSTSAVSKTHSRTSAVSKTRSSTSAGERIKAASVGGAVLAAVALSVLGAGACSGNRVDFTDPSPPFTTLDAGSPEPPDACGFRCSRDLKKVLSGCGPDEDQVVAECQAGQGCGIDKCVGACDAAALSKGSAGCSFWTMPADDGRHGAGSCFAAMIANTWDVPVNIRAGYGPDPLDISRSVYTVSRAPGEKPTYTRVEGSLPPGEVAIVFLSQAEVFADPDAPKCPAGTVPALNADPIRHGTAMTRAFHIETDAPVAAYSIFPYGGAESFYPTATLLLPVSSWDKSYVAVSTAKFGKAQMSLLDQRTVQIVANEDDTVVSMRPVADVAPGADVSASPAAEVATWTLSRGQALQLTQVGALSGSPLISSKPVGVFGGSPCTYIPGEADYCDLTQQQITPLSQWGTSYALVPYRSRVTALSGSVPETVPWSFVGAVDGTVLTYDPEKPPGAPETLSAGEVATFMTDALVTVRSQDSKHPFFASVYMTGANAGGGVPGGGRTLGDPDFVNVVPSDQFLDRYVFFADYTYPETTLTIVRRKTERGFLPVKLACGGEVAGFAPLGVSGEYEFAWVRLTTAFAAQQLDGGKCGYGRHEAASEGPFSITVWGWGKDASYGYAGGLGSRPINDAPVPEVK